MEKKPIIPADAKENLLVKLDMVLMYLYVNDKYLHTLDEIQKGVYKLIESDDNEISLILGKLETEKFVLKHPAQTLDDTGMVRRVVMVNQFAITFDGKIFLKQGGYNLEAVTNAAQSKKLETLKSDQIKRDESLKILTKWIAVGAIVAGLYYGIEIYKELHLFAHHHGRYWFWENIPISKKK